MNVRITYDPPKRQTATDSAACAVGLSHRGSRVVAVSWCTSTTSAAGGLSGGVSSSMAGGDFWDGVCNGLICAGLNHALHWVAETMVGPDDPPEKNTKNKSPNKDNKVVEGSAVISGEAAIVKTAADWAAGGNKVEILNGISKWSKRLGIAGTVINVAVNVNKAVQVKYQTII